MKRTLGQVLRCVLIPVVGIAAAGVLGVGCSKDSTNPTAVTVSELKYPGDLVITDNGNGKVSLAWFASNNESKFDGFNVYGMKATTPTGTVGSRTFTDLGVTEGQPIQLLDDAGDPVAAPGGNTILANFDYDPAGKKIEAKGADPAAAADASGDTPKFSARPMFKYDADGTTMLLPTCKASNTSTCTLTATAQKGQPDVGNGTINYDVSQTDTLVVGSTYCFFVLSSESEGGVVSQTSSNVACVTPKYTTLFTLPMPAKPATGKTLNLGDARVLKLADWQADCVKNAKCADPNTTFVADDNPTKVDGTTPRAHNNTDEEPVYLESGISGLGMIAGKNSGITDLGYYTGFGDATLPQFAPKFTVDTNTITADADTPPVLNGGGYSLGGQTVPLEKGHIYVIAVGDGKATTVPTSFLYFWLYVSGDPTPAAADGTVAVEVRVPFAAQ